jgi:hypothetical protein
MFLFQIRLAKADNCTQPAPTSQHRSPPTNPDSVSFGPHRNYQLVDSLQTKTGSS